MFYQNYNNNLSGWCGTYIDDRCDVDKDFFIERAKLAEIVFNWIGIT